MPEPALGGIPLGFGVVVEDKPSELSYKNTQDNHHFSYSNMVHLTLFHFLLLPRSSNKSSMHVYNNKLNQRTCLLVQCDNLHPE